MALAVDAAGGPQPLPFPEFKRRLATLRNYANPVSSTGTITEDRKRIEKRIADAKRKPNRTELESVALAGETLSKVG